MTTHTGPLGPRVGDLETAVAELKKTTAQLKRDQSATRRLVRELTKRVDAIIPSVKHELDEQTSTITGHVDEQLEQHRQFVLSTVIDVARQWPAPSIVAVTAVLALVVAIVAVWILNLTGRLHFG